MFPQHTCILHKTDAYMYLDVSERMHKGTAVKRMSHP